METTSLSLLDALRQSTPSVAWRRFVELYTPLIYYWLRRAGMSRDDKKLYWVGSSRDALRDFPEEARRRAGFELRALQRGDRPTDSKPMPDVGKGAAEIRIRTREAHRVFYVSRFAEAIYVLHAFQKKTQKTSKKDIEAGRRRYREMELHRLGEGGRSHE